ncbi:MAG: type II and III secretion system protein [Candidatus Cloacimonadales bacterium]|nr:type II and III secretion system protein [Candidatus Cloacimonadales bacterium]
MKKLFFLLILMLCSGLCLSQGTYQDQYQEFDEEEYEPEVNEYSPREIISISRTTNLVAAIRALEVISLQFENKKIVNISTNNNPIGFPINQMYWKDALKLLAKVNGFNLEERPGAYIVSDESAYKSMDQSGIPGTGMVSEIVTPRTKQVRISSIFFKTDKTLSRDIGIDWSTLLRGNVNANVNFSGANKVSDDIFKASLTHNFQSGDVIIQLNALLRILEQYQKGSVVARPTVTVISGKKGYIQVGQDFSVKSLDDAGNTTEQFFTTGIILDVTPRVITIDDLEAINLEVMVEKSSALPGAVSTVINKSQSTTNVILFNGEETVIGGLFDTDRQSTRAGIPFLKDLPWWVFGLRYIFGYNSWSSITNEMIIVLKAEIVDNLEDRIIEGKPLKDEMDNEKNEFEKAKEIFDYK